MNYQVAKFQFCRLSLASFIDRFRKHNDDVIMTSFYVVGILKSQIFRNSVYTIISQSLKSLDYLDQILWRLL